MPFLAIRRFLFNFSCPNCASAPRHRAHRIFYESVLDFSKCQGSLLYFAPERNVEFFRKNPKLSVKTSNYPEGTADYCVDILEIPFADGSWDFIVCHHVIEHLSDDRKGMREFLRVLKPGGKAIVSVPMDPRLGRTVEFGKPNPSEHEHYYRYGSDFAERIPDGFAVHTYKFSEFCGPEEWEEMALQEDLIFVLEKPSSPPVISLAASG